MPLPNSIQGVYTVRRNLEVLDRFKAGIVTADSVKGNIIANKDGLFSIRNLETDDDKVKITNAAGIYNISIADNKSNFPLYTDDTNAITLAYDQPLITTQNGLSICISDNLYIDETGALSVVEAPPDKVYPPLYRDEEGIHLAFDESLILNHGMIGLDYSEPLYINANRQLTIDYDSTLGLTENNELTVHVTSPLSVTSQGIVLDFSEPLFSDSNNKLNLHVADPFTVDAQGRLGLSLHASMKVNNDHQLEVNVTESLKALGALNTGFGADILVDEAMELGFESLSQLTDAVGDVNMTLLRLRTSPDFTQKSGKLEIVSQGNGAIPYYGVFNGFSARSTLFNYNETFNKLKVGDVELNQRFNFGVNDNNLAVTKGYVAQYIQSRTGGAIDVDTEVNNRRTLAVRYDATLQVDANNNLGVNVAPLVDGKTIRVVGGRISNGMTYNPAHGALKIYQGNTIMLAPTMSGFLTYDGESTFGETLTCSNGVKRVENDIQSSLTFGSGLKKVGDDVSVDFELHGTGAITVSGSTVSENLTASGAASRVMNDIYSKTVTAGTGITVVDTGFSYLISATSLRSQDDDEEKKQTSDEQDTLKTTTGQTIQTSGPVAVIIPPPLVGITPPIPVPPFVNGGVFPPAGVLPVNPKPLITMIPDESNEWGILYGIVPPRKVEKDENGNDLHDEFGNPIYEVDDDGIPLFQPRPNNIGIFTYNDKNCIRLLQDLPSCWLGIQNENPKQVVSLEILEEYHRVINAPAVESKIIEIVPQVVTPMLSNYTLVEDFIVEGRGYNERFASLDTDVSALQYSITQVQPKNRLLSDIADANITGENYIFTSKVVTDATTSFMHLIPKKPDDIKLLLGVTAAESNITANSTAIATKQNSHANLTSLSSATPTISGLTVTDPNGIHLAASNGALITKNFFMNDATTPYNLTGRAGVYMFSNALRLVLSNGSDTRSIGLCGMNSDGSTVDYLTVGMGTGNATFKGSVSCLTAPTLGEHLVNKTYVDSLSLGSGSTIVAGTGLTLTGSTLSVNAAQTGITSVGTLTGLESSGVVTITDTTDAPSANTGALIVSGGINIRKKFLLGNGNTFVYSSSSNGVVQYIGNGNISDSTTAASGTRASVSCSYFNAPGVYATNTGVTTTNAYTIFVAGAPVSATNNTITNPYALYVSSGRTAFRGRCEISMNAYNLDGSSVGNLQIGSGSTLTNNTAAASSTVSAFYANFIGNSTLAATNTGVTTTDAYTFYITGAPLSGTNMTITNLYALYVASGKSRLAILEATGIVTITNGVQSNSVGSGALQVTGGISTSNNIYVAGIVSCATAPTIGNHLVNKTYADSLTVTAGTGLTRTGTVLSVNAAQTEITSLGTLTGLTSSGVVSITAVGTGALQVAGGISCNGGLIAGTGLNFFTVSSSYKSGIIANNADVSTVLGNSYDSNNVGTLQTYSQGAANSVGANPYGLHIQPMGGFLQLGSYGASVDVLSTANFKMSSGNTLRIGERTDSSYGDTLLSIANTRASGVAEFGISNPNFVGLQARTTSVQLRHGFGIFSFNYNSSTGQHSFGVTNAGMLTITNPLTVQGSCTATSFPVSSDSRLKQNITKITDALDVVSRLQGVRYVLKADPTSKVQMGLIAQDTEAVAPEVVYTDDSQDGYKAVAYGNLVAILIEGLKALQARVVALENIR